VRYEVGNIAWAIGRRLESPLEISLETAKDVVDLATPPAAPQPVSTSTARRTSWRRSRGTAADP
jgi:hypothetical protein